MELEKLEQLAKVVFRDLKKLISDYDDYIFDKKEFKAKFKNLMSIANNTLPEHKHLFIEPFNSAENQYGLRLSEGRTIISHLLEIIQIEQSFQNSASGLKIFDSAQEKIKQASTI